MKKGNPSEKAIRLYEDLLTSIILNSPLKKIVLIRSSAQKNNPINDGRPINRTNL